MSSRRFRVRVKRDRIHGRNKPERSSSSRRPEISATPKIAIVETRVEQSVVPYDENLLERTRTQWQFGDWQSLSQLDRGPLQHHPDRAKLALLAAAGRLQTDQTNEAKQFIRLAQDWGVSKKLVNQILIAGVHNSLGRAAAVSGQQTQALQHFKSAIAIGTPGTDQGLLANARIKEQLAQLDLFTLEVQQKVSAGKPESRNVAESVLPLWLQETLKMAPDSPPLLIAAAEAAQRSGELDTAIRYWQRLAAVDGASMQQIYYDRLAQAYMQLKSFPTGSAQEEALCGDIDKHQVLKKIHQVLRPRSYLEIGVQTGRSLFLANCPAVGVDPMPMVSIPLPDQVKLVRTTSDDFFAKKAPELILAPIDMFFIDGMHLFEYALRDFINIERYAGSNSLAVIDDILPGHPAQASRHRHTRAWTGDVWKLLLTLQQHRTDLSLLLLNAYPTGLLCISGLNPSSTFLQENYKSIVTEWSADAPLPDTILSRVDALPCSHQNLEALLVKLRDTRELAQG